MSDHSAAVARELGVSVEQVGATRELLDGGATVPFIARYRKEATGSLDEVQVTAVRDRVAQLVELDKRRAAILASLSERGLLDEALERSVNAAVSLTILEDIYLPHRPKRRTRAMAARELGLEPLAQALLAQTGARIDIDPYVDPGKGIADRDAALAGARDIIAEDVSEDAAVRQELRELFARKATLASSVVKKKETEASKFRDWFDWSEPLARAPSHRVLAILRGTRRRIPPGPGPARRGRCPGPAAATAFCVAVGSPPSRWTRRSWTRTTVCSCPASSARR